MLIKELTEKINIKGTPIIFHDKPLPKFDYCFAVTMTTEELTVVRGRTKADSLTFSDKELGVHLVNAELEEVYDSYLKRNPKAVDTTCSLISKHYKIPAEKKIFAYVLFTVLHEIGHWQHLVESGLSRINYWKTYEAKRDMLWIIFQSNYMNCTNEVQRKEIFVYFNEQYRKLPSETFANEYALQELSNYLPKL